MRGTAVRLARRLGTSSTGVALRLLLTASLMASFVAFAAVAPQPAYAAPAVTREHSPEPVTIGETIDCTVTVTIEPQRHLLVPRIRDEFTNRAVYYVPGSAEILDISRPAGITSAASFTDPSGDPDVIYDPNEGLKLRWPLNEIQNNTDEPYTFVLRYQVQVTGVGPNDFVFWFPAWANQGFDATSFFVWQAAADPGNWRNVTSAAVWTDVDQPRLRVDKQTFDLGADVALGAQVPFNITITNTGWSTAYDISLLDDTQSGDFGAMPVLVSALHSGDGYITDSLWFAPVGEDATLNLSNFPLAPGETIQLEILATVGPTAVAGGTVTNWVDVDWSSLGGDVLGERVYDDAAWEDFTADTDTATLNVVNGAFIRVDKQLAGDSRFAIPFGGETTFDITLTNTGSTGAGAIGLTDIFDANALEFVEASVTPSGVMTSEIDWNDVTSGNGLAAGASLTLQVTMRAKSTAGYTSNTAFAWDPDAIQQAALGADGVDASWLTLQPHWSFGGEDYSDLLIYDAGAITFTKDANPGTSTILLPGDVITYHLYGENSTGYDLPEVLAFDPLPASVEYVAGTLRAVVPGYGEMAFTDAMLDGAGDMDDYGWYDPATRTAYFFAAWGAPQGMLADMYFDVRVRDLTYSAAGVLNTGHLIVNPTAITDTPTTSTNAIYHFVDPITITKTATDVNGGKLVPGDEILWTIIVQNIGLSQTTNVVVNDTVPTATTYVMGSITGTGATDVAAPALRWNVGVLAVGQSATLTFRSRVNPGTPAGTAIPNQATVDSDQSNVRASDFPSTSVRGDVTLLRTGGDELLLLAIGVFMALAGVVLVKRGRSFLVR